MIFYEKEKEKIMKKIEQNLKNLWDTAMYTNIHITGFPGGKEKRKIKNTLKNNGHTIPKLDEKH